MLDADEKAQLEALVARVRRFAIAYCALWTVLTLSFFALLLALLGGR